MATRFESPITTEEALPIKKQGRAKKAGVAAVAALGIAGGLSACGDEKAQDKDVSHIYSSDTETTTPEPSETTTDALGKPIETIFNHDVTDAFEPRTERDAELMHMPYEEFSTLPEAEKTKFTNQLYSNVSTRVADGSYYILYAGEAQYPTSLDEVTPAINGTKRDMNELSEYITLQEPASASDQAIINNFLAREATIRTAVSIEQRSVNDGVLSPDDRTSIGKKLINGTFADPKEADYYPPFDRNNESEISAEMMREIDALANGDMGLNDYIETTEVEGDLKAVNEYTDMQTGLSGADGGGSYEGKMIPVESADGTQQYAIFAFTGDDWKFLYYEKAEF